jgi:exopolysaccharide biosynthesis polyprenyl glycosylphosphotransferase
MFKTPSSNELLLRGFMDLWGMGLALWLASHLRDWLPLGREISANYILPWQVAALLWLIGAGVFISQGVYSPAQVGRAGREYQAVVLACLLCLLAQAGGLYFSFREVSRLFVLYVFVFNLSLLLAWRFIWYSWLKKTQARLKVLIVGDNHLGEAVRTHLAGQAHLGLHALAVQAYSPDVASLAHKQGAEAIILAFPMDQAEQLNGAILQFQARALPVWMVPDYLSLSLYRTQADNLEGLPILNLRALALSPGQRIIKRCFDILVASCLLIWLSPLLGFLGLLIAAQKQGGVIFRQDRVGEGGQVFKMYKFRTMIPGAEKTPPQDKHPDDPRITRLGAWLRRSSLDELPQLFNVLKGEMSLVGPRPELPWRVAEYQGWQHQRFSVLPGMTGWWQIHGRSDKPMHTHTHEDLYYIQHYSLWLDLYILWRTLPVVWQGRGAY